MASLMARNILALHPRYISSSVPGLVKWISFGHTLPSQLCILPACRTVVAMSIMCNVQCVMCNVQCAMCNVQSSCGTILGTDSATSCLLCITNYLRLYFLSVFVHVFLLVPEFVPVFVHSCICTFPYLYLPQRLYAKSDYT